MSLSACMSDTQQPTTLPPASTPSPGPTAAPSTTASVVTPVPPPEMSERTAAGAQATARYYFAVVDYSYASRNTSLLLAVSHSECAPCERVTQLIENALSSDATYRRAPTVISHIGDIVGDPSGPVELDVTYSSSGLSKLDDKGSLIASTEAVVEQRLRLLLVPADTTWLVRNYKEVT